MDGSILDRPGWQIVRAMREAGVSQLAVARRVPAVDRTVVSKVIHRAHGVSPGTRERVWAVLREMLGNGAGPRERGAGIGRRRRLGGRRPAPVSRGRKR